MNGTNGKIIKHSVKLAIPQSGDVAACRAVIADGGAIRSDKKWKSLTDKNVSSGIVGRSAQGYVTYGVNKIYLYDGNDLQAIGQLTGNVKYVSSTNMRGSLIFSAKYAGTYSVDTAGVLSKITDDSFYSVTTCCERVIGIVGNRLCFGLIGNTKLTYDGDYIDLPTDCDAVVGFGSYVYALGKSCYKVKIDANVNDIKAEKIADGLGGVNERSVAVVGDRIVFAAANGLYALRGDRLTRVCDGIASNLDLSECRANSYEGKYFLSDCKTTKTALLLDVENGSCERVFQKGLIEIYTYADETIAVFEEGQFKTLGEADDDDVCWGANGNRL
ncbi:MAG: hypothetical protein NC099_04350 [Corallococcus sp.]|nr:hypothetical protein [Corallococcus sp.]